MKGYCKSAVSMRIAYDSILTDDHREKGHTADSLVRRTEGDRVDGGLENAAAILSETMAVEVVAVDLCVFTIGNADLLHTVRALG